ncbi:MAG: glycosyl hydrolase [bacterium]
MSVNGRDIPTRDAVPTQSSKLFYCYPAQKKQLKCPTFEDYYPGDDYVDLMGMTFYNRGKAQTNRLRQTPYEIIDNKQRHTLSRIKKFQKPLFIDEVGTTAVRYNEKYNQAKSQAVFANETKRKDDWLDSLRLFLINEPQIVGTIYFNVDLTN